MSQAGKVKRIQLTLAKHDLYAGKIDGVIELQTISGVDAYLQSSVYVPTIERKLDLALDKLDQVLNAEKHEEETSMASQATLDKLTAQVAANTSATAAAAAALTGFVSTVADLTQKLQDAIASGDQVAVQAAADAIEANNATLTAATPAMAAAVEANT